MIATRPAFFTTDDHAGLATYGQFRGGNGYATCMEHTIILAPHAHGRGLGRALMQAVESHAKAHGAHQMIAGICGRKPRRRRLSCPFGIHRGRPHRRSWLSNSAVSWTLC